VEHHQDSQALKGFKLISPSPCYENLDDAAAAIDG